MSVIEANAGLVNGLIECMTIALHRDLMPEAETLLSALRVLRPGLSVLDIFEAWIALKRGQFTQAAQMLRNMDFEKGAPAIGKALRACCLFAVGDPDWRISAEEVISENTDKDAVALVGLLTGQTDINASLETSSTKSASAPSQSNSGSGNGPSLPNTNFLRV